MKICKKICNKSVIILMALIIGLSMPLSIKINAKETNLSRNNQAEVLNKLDILRGSGESFELDKKLTRAEAATFIVRLLGKEDLVNSQKDQYSYTSYTDVSPDEWYAAYVGYCDKNSIINGYADKTFKPHEYLSEKAFLKMLLTSVGYGYNVDFTWNNVNYYAHKAGIVDDAAYSKNVDDVITNYTRGDVVEVIFSTLQVISKETSMRMIQSFIDKDLITKYEATNYGLIEDSIDAEIDSVSSNSETSIDVTFNEPVIMINLEDVQIYEKNNKEIVLNPIEIVKGTKEDTYRIKLESPQKMDEDYTIEIIDIIDEYGNRSELVSYDFIGYRPDTIESDFFMISKIEPMNSNLINVYFTHPINENILSPEYFTLKDMDQTLVVGAASTMQVSKLANVNNGISIYLRGYSLKADTNYRLAIDGKAISQYGVNLKDGLGDTIKFKGISISGHNPQLELIDIVPLNNKTIQLNFSKAINPTIAEQVFSYNLETSTNSPIRILKAVVDQTNGASVNLSIETSMTDKQKYNLMINRVNDISRLYSIEEQSFEFTYTHTVSVPTEIRIRDAYSIDAGTIELHVDRQLDEESARLISNYSIRNVTDSRSIGSPSAVYYDKNVDPYLVKIYLQQGKLLSGNKKYEISLSTGLKDASGNPQKTSDKYTFNHNNVNITDAYFEEAVIIGSNTIKLTSNKELAYDIKNVVSSNYSLIYIDEYGVTSRLVPINTEYINERTIILRFHALDTSKSYEITFKELIDYINNVTKNTNEKYKIDVVMGR